MRLSFIRAIVTISAGWSLALVSTSCNGPDPNELPPPEPVLHPVSGKVTVQGKPLVTAVVTFLPTDGKGTLCIGETDEDGDYEITHLGQPGAAAATYKVAISYLQGNDGTIYGMAPRSGLAKPYGMVTATERLAPEWSNMGVTKHTVTIPEKGGTFDFAIEEPLLPMPAPEPAAKPTEGAKEAAPSSSTPKAEAPASKSP